MIDEVSKYTVGQIKGDTEKRDNLVNAYNSLFEDELVLGCNNCIQDAIYRIQYYIKNKNKKIMEAKKSAFKLKDGLVLWVGAWHKHITNDNLTDEIAIKLLQLTRANSSQFQTMPDEWEKLAYGKLAEKIEPKRVDEKGTEKTEIPSPQQLYDDNTAKMLKELLVDYPKDANKKELAELYHKKLVDESNSE